MNFHNYEKHITVPYSRCDFREKLMLSDILREAQDISMEHCDSVGIDGAFYEQHKRLFLMAKVQVDVTRYPCGGERLRVFTQPYEPMGPQYQRFTHFFDENGEMIIHCDARWVLIDTDTHRISRDPADKQLFVFDQGPKPKQFKPDPIEPLAEVAQVPLTYTVVDRNRHFNNAAYADLLCNVLQQQLYGGKEISQLRIFYHNEAMYNSTVTLLQGTDGNQVYFKGMLPDCECFEANVTLR